ncbi:unnamed protein product [Symbiodinium necroappetens]|uniref:Uncharacterized protein n=1 Tax=Symbiodinium necroappetens TaxID=1628268 RepID=A0A812LV28_9DINO|nr:unnamed protein product [Symbiodinium necroappetens]
MFSLSDLRSSFTAPKRSSRTYTTIEATALHESVPPDRWCITRSDLKYLGQEVRKAIQSGEIRPPDDGSDDFQASDTRYGPSIYTVNKQHIMPVTERFGKVSWALLQHPDGLDCDLFISHAWQEGVFEFLSKVLHSWPADARHAWCCMLANPQNLDIGSLLQSPISSPFALALKASTYVLVVPNHHCSIYTRLWCGYEAFRAHEEGKTIFVARAPTGKKKMVVVLWTTLAGLLGFLLGIFSWHLHGLYLCVMTAAAFGSVCMEHQACRRILNLTGAFMCGTLLYRWKVIVPLHGLTRHLALIPDAAQHLLLVSGILFFNLLEVDRIIGQSQIDEAKQLSHGYQGSIEDATCSEAADTMRIFQEIGERTGDVDYAIHVLLGAGMSTPTLRTVARAGVDISGAGYTEMAFPCLDLGPFLIHSVSLVLTSVPVYRLQQCYRWIPCLLSTCARLILLISLWRSANDERCFILKMMAKMIAMYVGLTFPLVVIFQIASSRNEWSFFGITVFIMIVHSIMVGSACLGMQRLATLPLAGPCMLQLFLGRGRCSVASTSTGVAWD